nr:hypothetical protein [uncultured Pedobacter sp.]
MKKLMILTLLLLGSCSVFKDKMVLKTDSLRQINTIAKWRMNEQWHNSEYQLKDSNGLYAVWIKADAPFKWQLDSGLSAAAGNYQLYVAQQAKSVTAKKQLGQKVLKGQNSSEKKEVQKSEKVAKKVSLGTTKATLIGLLLILLLLAFVIARRSRLLRML